MKDKDKILFELKKAASFGIHSFDLIKLTGTYRVAARINDLKREGYIIHSQPETKGNTRGVRYTLVYSPSRQVRETKPAYTYSDPIKKQAHKPVQGGLF